MTTFGWILAGYLVACTLGNVLTVGERRPVVSPGSAALTVLLNGGCVLGIFLAGTGHL